MTVKWLFWLSTFMLLISSLGKNRSSPTSFLMEESQIISIKQTAFQRHTQYDTETPRTNREPYCFKVTFLTTESLCWPRGSILCHEWEPAGWQRCSTVSPWMSDSACRFSFKPQTASATSDLARLVIPVLVFVADVFLVIFGWSRNLI